MAVISGGEEMAGQIEAYLATQPPAICLDQVELKVKRQFCDRVHVNLEVYIHLEVFDIILCKYCMCNECFSLNAQDS